MYTSPNSSLGRLVNEKKVIYPHLMEAWGYAWLLTVTVTGIESCDSLRLSSAASCSSPLLRASLRDRASSSAAKGKDINR